MDDNNNIIEMTDVLDLSVEGLKVLEEKKKVGYSSSSYGYSSSSSSTSNNQESDFRTVYFYEFSDITRKPKIFSTVTQFVNWAKECKILISSYMESALRKTPTSFCICRKGYSTIIQRESKSELEKSLKNLSDCYQPYGVGASSYGRNYWDDYGYDDWD